MYTISLILLITANVASKESYLLFNAAVFAEEVCNVLAVINDGSM